MSDRQPGPNRRGRAAAFGLVLGGGLLGLLLAGQNWWTPGLPATGNQPAVALAGVLGGAATAGGALALLLRTRGRRVLGVLLTALGLGMVLTGVVAEPPPNPAIFPGPDDPAATGLQFGYAGSGLLVALGGVLFVLCAHTWPARPDRFGRLARAAAVRAEDDAGEVWKALDQGFDPTRVDTDDTSGRKSGDRGE